MTISHTLRKRLQLLAAPLLTIAAAGILGACEDTVPTVGGELATGEVQIALDTLVWNGTEQNVYRGDQTLTVSCPKLSYTTLFNDTVDTRSTTNLIGRMSVPEYGDLNCSFVSRMMCTTSIPDSLTVEKVDSMMLRLSVLRGQLTGDSLAPQQLRAYQLTKSLPNDITNSFDPTGYYDPAKPLGTRSYTLSSLSLTDSTISNNSFVNIDIPLSKEWAQKIVTDYTNPATKPTFAWPQSFERYFHGIYVEPTFGRGCVADIAYTDFVIFYHYQATTQVTNEGVTRDSVYNAVGLAGVFSSSPIVLSSNNVSYRPSAHLKQLAADKEAIITTPGGYRVNFKFPGRELVDLYNKSQSNLAVVSDLKFSIPAEEIENEHNLTPPPYLAMVKTSKLAEFLSSNSLPDGKNSFYATYSTSEKRYDFTSMRNYMLDLLRNGIKDEDLDFTIIPINLEFDESSSSTGNSYLDMIYGTSSSTTVLTPIKCTPYILKPTMCRLKIDEARTIFSYSIQQMK